MKKETVTYIYNAHIYQADFVSLYMNKGIPHVYVTLFPPKWVMELAKWQSTHINFTIHAVTATLGSSGVYIEPVAMSIGKLVMVRQLNHLNFVIPSSCVSASI